MKYSHLSKHFHGEPISHYSTNSRSYTVYGIILPSNFLNQKRKGGGGRPYEPAIHKTDCIAHDYSEGTGDTGSGYARERADIAGRSQPADISAISWYFLETSRMQSADILQPSSIRLLEENPS